MRYHTKSMEKAFWFIDQKNRLENKNVWRVAMKVKNRVVFDIDNKSKENLMNIKEYYERLLQIKFKAFQTNGGYHIFSLKYQPDMKVQCEYDQCRILNPLLEKLMYPRYQEAIQKWYEEEGKKHEKGEVGRFVNKGIQKFLSSGLCTFPSSFDFDVLFAINVIRKGYYCIRISKKNENDQPVEVFL